MYYILFVILLVIIIYNFTRIPFTHSKDFNFWGVKITTLS